MFPLDMLRFGRCWPKDLESVAAMEYDNSHTVRAVIDSHGERHIKPSPSREVTLCCMGSYMQAHAIKSRFDSFGWTAEITLEDRV